MEYYCFKTIEKTLNYINYIQLHELYVHNILQKQIIILSFVFLIKKYYKFSKCISILLFSFSIKLTVAD